MEESWRTHKHLCGILKMGWMRNSTSFVRPDDSFLSPFPPFLSRLLLMVIFVHWGATAKRIPKESWKNPSFEQDKMGMERNGHIMNVNKNEDGKYWVKSSGMKENWIACGRPFVMFFSFPILYHLLLPLLLLLVLIWWKHPAARNQWIFHNEHFFPLSLSLSLFLSFSLLSFLYYFGLSFLPWFYSLLVFPMFTSYFALFLKSSQLQRIRFHSAIAGFHWFELIHSNSSESFTSDCLCLLWRLISIDFIFCIETCLGVIQFQLKHANESNRSEIAHLLT